jgi:signal transduction histidine kinase
VRYLIAIVTSVLAALANAALWPEFGSRYPLIAFYPAIIVSSWFGGFWPGALSTALTASVAALVWFAPQSLTHASRRGDAIALGLFVGIGLMVAALYEALSRRTRRAEDAERVARRLSNDLRQSQERLAREVVDLTRLRELSTGLLRADDLPAVLHEMLEASIDLLQADRGYLQVYDEATGDLRVVAQVGFGDEFLKALAAAGPARSVSGRALVRRARVIVADVSNDPATADLAPAYAAEGVAAMVSTPLFGSHGALAGMLSAHFRHPHSPSDRDLELLDLYTYQAERAVERGRALDRERLARQQAERAAQLKGEFLSMVSHELRTPLSAIVGWADMLSGGLVPHARQDHALQAIRRSAHEQVRLLEELLDAARIEAGQQDLDYAPIDLRTVLHDAWEIVEPAAAAKGLEYGLVFDSGAATDPFYGDAARLRQIMSNLFSNAVKYTPAGGRVSTRLRRDDGMAEIVVSDTGRGISPEFLPLVFEPFHQADPRLGGPQTGFGLGLWIVRRLVEAHGGEVRVASDGQDCGATITVRLPTLANVSAPRTSPAHDSSRF